MMRLSYPIVTHSQFALRILDLQQTTTVAQNDLTILVLSDEANLLKAIRLRIAHAPDLCCKLITRPNRRCKACLELFEVGRITATQLAQYSMRSGIPAEQAVNNGPSKAHLLTWLGGSVQGVVVTIYPMYKFLSFSLSDFWLAANSIK